LIEPSGSVRADARSSTDLSIQIRRAAETQASGAAKSGDALFAPAVGLLAAVCVAVVGLSLTGLSPSGSRHAEPLTAIAALDIGVAQQSAVQATEQTAAGDARGALPVLASEGVVSADETTIIAQTGLARPRTLTLPTMVFSRAIEPAVASLDAPLTLPVALIANDIDQPPPEAAKWANVDARSMSEIALDLAEIAPAAAPPDHGLVRVSDNRLATHAFASFVVYEWGVGAEMSRDLVPASRYAERVVDGPTTQTVEALSAHFEEIDYDLASVINEPDQVPRIFVAQLPKDLADAETVQVRKAVFIKSVLPVVLRVNEDILLERRRLIRVRKQLAAGLVLDDVDREWLDVLTERYETEPGDVDELLQRVDVIPVSLALAQAAEESGWGTSRFAREGNALFGMYTYKKSKGIVPTDRGEGHKHQIHAYANLLETVRSYMHNLNYHRAYGEFRATRAVMRDANNTIDGHKLAGELKRYSERGTDYVRTIRGIIRYNSLDALDRARLIDRQWSRIDSVDNQDQPS